MLDLVDAWEPFLLLPHETVSLVWEKENFAPLSHPYFMTPLLCQGGNMNIAKGVYMCPVVFMHLLRLVERRYSCAHGIARGRLMQLCF